MKNSPAHRPFQQLQLDSVAAAPDQRVADHLQAIEVAEVPTPGPGELLVRLVLSPIHPCDILCAAGLVPRRHGERDGHDNDQFVPGVEGLAQIETVGAGLEERFTQGQRVFVCCWAPWGQWSVADGVWSEYLRVRPENLVMVPDDISDSSAAMFLVIPVTVYVMMFEQLNLQPGDWLIQNAAGSELGKWAIALAELLGIRTINLVRREEQVEELRRDTGTEHVLWCPPDGSAHETLVKQIREITGNANVSGALDAVGDGVFVSLMLQTLSRHASIIVYGVLGGTELKVPFERLCHIPLEDISIRGFSLQNWWLPDTDDEAKHRVFDAVWQLISEHNELNPEVAGIYPFEQISEAIRASLRQKKGKVLLRPRGKDQSSG